MSRLEKWRSDYWRSGFVMLGTMPDQLSELVREGSNKRDSDSSESPVFNLYKMAKEIIFDINSEGKVTLMPMTWLLEGETFDYVLSGVIQGIFDDDEEVKQDIAWALYHETPVVPNSDVVAPRLEAIYADLMANGLRIKHEGTLKQFTISELLRFDPESSVKAGRLIIQPAEVGLLSARLREEQAQNDEVKAVLARLTAAGVELRRLLAVVKRNEHDLQRCLTKYPILFGPNYRKVLPKHRLGSDFETDYALELADGSIDVMEIEASTHRIYKANGDPTAALVHAEQQVLDWLAWLDKNSPYAREKLPGIRRACGIVVIGTRAKLNESEEERLRWRNMMYAGRLTVLTYDDLLDRCEALHRLLLGNS
jgi:Domain of unknown function (DUF4263)